MNMDVHEDQAAELRERQVEKGPSVPRNLRCIAVGSGKGGVGKTVISIGLSLSLARMNYRVLIMDADLGLANVDIQIGVDPKFTMQDVVFGNCSIEDAVMNIEENLDLLPSSSGTQEMVDMGDARRQMFVKELVNYAAGYDFLIIDVAAGIGKDITTFLAAAPEVIVVVANEPTSIMDAYSLIKVLKLSNDPPVIMGVMNMVRSLDEGEELSERLSGITQRFLGFELPVAGMVVFDESVRDSVRARRSVVAHASKSAPAQCIGELAKYIAAGKDYSLSGTRLKESFFDKFAAVSMHDSQMGGGNN